MSQINRLQTIDADTLQSTAYEPVSFVVDDLLPQGLHLLAGAPKIGKSWLALWLCLCAAQGKPLWTFATRPCEVLYLCLEDSFQRIQSRLFDLTEDAPPTLHFAVMSQQLHNGLVEQIEQFLKEHPQTRLIVIDTLQRIRTAGNDANPYASDYRDIGVLKALADKHRIAILLVHHLRKMNDDDPVNMISGTTGLSGATDSNFVLRKSKRRENTATLYCTGRDIPYRELALEFDGEDHVWKLLSDDCEQKEQPNERILFLLSELLRQQPEISAPAKALLEKIDPAGTEGLTPNSFSHRIRKSVDTLIFEVNGQALQIESTSNDSLVVIGQTDYKVCPACGYASETGIPLEHKNSRGYRCVNKEGNSAEYRLSHDFKTDVAKITFVTQEAADINVMLSVLYALLEGLSREMGIERTDIKGCLFYTSVDGCMIFSVVLYDAVAGGAGHVRRIVTADGQAFQRVLAKAISVVDNCDCDSSCYRCLRNYYNQKIHDNLNRNQASAFLHQWVGNMNPLPVETIE